MMRTLILLAFGLSACAQTPVFLEPVEAVDTNRAEIGGGPKTYRVVDGAKYRPWLENPSARRALRLYSQAFRILDEGGNPQRQPREYYIALVKGGNHAAVGFRIQGSGGITEHNDHAYILLEPSPANFESTLLHETGHVAMAMLAGGKQLPRADVASIPHSTAALTDRGTAFAEGYAIHLETLAAHMAADAESRVRFFHEAVTFGAGGPYPTDEYFRHAADLATFSQSIARYTEVRDNNYSFASAYKGPDYLRVQLEKARDFAEVRDANQLLQSEGFQASFFFLFLMRGPAKPSEAVIAARQEQMLRAMRAMFLSVTAEEDTPWLPQLVIAYMKAFPAERDAIVDALNELSHGVFVDAQAAVLWRQHYLAALQLDLEHLNREAVIAARKRWREQVVANPQLLLSRVGPQVRCEVKTVQVKLVAFGDAEPLLLDVNTAEPGVMRLVPGVGEAELAKWVSGRPYATLEAFRNAVGVCR